MRLPILILISTCLFAQAPGYNVIRSAQPTFSTSSPTHSYFTLVAQGSTSVMMTISPDGKVHISKGFTADQVIKRLASVWQQELRQSNDYHRTELDTCMAGWKKSNDDLAKFAGDIRKALNK